MLSHEKKIDQKISCYSPFKNRYLLDLIIYRETLKKTTDVAHRKYLIKYVLLTVILKEFVRGLCIFFVEV